MRAEDQEHFCTYTLAAGEYVWRVGIERRLWKTIFGDLVRPRTPKTLALAMESKGERVVGNVLAHERRGKGD